MENFRYVNTKFWDDNYIATLDPSEKLVFLYFMTNPLTNLCGIYEISTKRIISDTGFNIDTLNLIINRFNQDGKIIYFKGWVFVKNHVKNQRYKGEKIEIAIKKELSRIPEDILANFKDFKIPHQYPIDTLFIDNTKNDPKISEQIFEQAVEQMDKSNISEIQIPHDKDKDKGINRENTLSCPNPATAGSDQKYLHLSDFTIFWNIYPKKVGKKKVMEVFLKTKGVKIKTIVEAIEKQKKSQQWQNAQFIPLPLTWLNQGRWDDEETVVSGDNSIQQEIIDLIKKNNGDKTAAMFDFSNNPKNNIELVKKYIKMFD